MIERAPSVRFATGTGAIDLDDGPTGLVLRAVEKAPLTAESHRNKLGSELEATYSFHCLLAAWHIGHTLPVGGRAGIGAASAIPLDGRRWWPAGAGFSSAVIPQQPGSGVSVEPRTNESAAGHIATV